MSAPIARRLVIRGRVQGVGYRDAMIDIAQELGVGGWVRNLRDGSVEAFVQGADDDVRKLVEWAANGPPAASVTAVEATEASVDPTLRGFVRRPWA